MCSSRTQLNYGVWVSVRVYVVLGFSGVDIHGVYRVCTHDLSEKYAIFDIAESRFFQLRMHQNRLSPFVCKLVVAQTDIPLNELF